ncbi:MAG: hypothetical protein WA777_12200, partial [Rhodanobacter sp.]
VLPPFVVFKSGAMNAQRLDETAAALGERLDDAMHTTPIAYRSQNHGDYNIPALTLKTGLGSGRTGFALHQDDGIESDIAPGNNAARHHITAASPTASDLIGVQA